MVSLESELWREAATHIELETLVPRLHRLLRERIGSECLVLRRYVESVGRFDTRAAAGRHATQALSRPRTDPTGPELDAGLKRLTSPTPIVVRANDDTLRPLAPRGVVAPYIVLPLPSGRSLTGAAWLGLAADADVATTLRSIEPAIEVLKTALARDAHLAELATRRRAAEAEVELLRSQALAGGAEVIPKDILKPLARVSATDVSVLIHGGSRKVASAVARAVHSRSPRARGPFVVADGEAQDDLGRGLERANGGTLLVRDVHALSPENQTTLLRVLEDGVLVRDGSKRLLPVDVRLVAATDVDLPSRVSKGAFREELVYRLGLFSLRLASDETRSDEGERTSFESAHESLPPAVRSMAPPKRAQSSAPPKRAQSSAPPSASAIEGPSLIAMEQALSRAHGRIEGPFGAATALGVNPHTLRSRMRKLGIDWRKFR
jgi:hydrogenase-4 transcriptional activator